MPLNAASSKAKPRGRREKHKRRLDQHFSPFFRTKTCPAAALTSATCYEFSSVNQLDRPGQTRLTKSGEASKVTYQHNALGQRVFKSEPQADQYLPNEQTLGPDFIAWLKKNFAWLFAAGQANATLGDSYIYADSQGTGLPSYVLLGEYANGGTGSGGRTEYLWLPTEDASQAIPIGIARGGKLLAVHTDHLGTPRQLKDETGKVQWQWPYSAFGENKPTGILTATANPKAALTNQPVLLKASTPAEFNLRLPGQYADQESGLFYNYFRSYNPGQGRYTQGDPIGMEGGLNRFAYVEGNPLSYSDPRGLNPLAGAIGGAGIGTAIFPGVGTVIGGAVGAGIGAAAGWYILGPMLAKPPENAYDPNGPKAPGRPTEADGFKPPKGGDNWVPNPNPGKGGSGYGWEDSKGDVWCPTGPAGPGSRAHGGPHWDVQSPGGGYRNKRPGQ